jgi:hypothetical protein
MAMFEAKLEFPILRQPDLTTCGPTCLHGVYRYFGDDISLGQVIEEVETLEEGGTLAVMLAVHALRRGYRTRIYSYNLKVFDPSWFVEGVDIPAKLRAQAAVKRSRKLQQASRAYQEFFRLGGQLRFEDLTPKLIRKFVSRGTPILTGLSATYLYREAREMPDSTHDDIKGEPSGHFVVLCGYTKETREVHVADPFVPNAIGPAHHYNVPIERVVGAVYLGIVTYDSNLLIIEPAKG